MMRIRQINISLLLLVMPAITAQAATGIRSAGLMDDILERFAATASGWGTRMVDFGSWLFFGLALISMLWTFGFMALKKADLQEFFAEIVQFLVTTGFFLWILRNGPAISLSMVDSLRQIAAEASGLGGLLSPSGIIDIGFDIAGKVVDQSSLLSPSTSLAGVLVAIVILIALTLVSVNMLLMLIAVWLLAYAGVFLLGFGGGRWTQDIAIQYYKKILGVGVQIFAMTLIVGIGKSFIDQVYANMTSDMTIQELLVMLVVAIILALMVEKLPPMLASIVDSSTTGGGLGSFGLGAGLGAASMAAAAMSGAGSGVIGAGASMAGGGSALQAAFQAAQQGMSSGAASGGSAPSSGGGLASAFGEAGRFAAAMGSELMQGTSQVASDKLSALKEAFSERVADTTGGQIASAICQASGMDTSAADAQETIASNDSQLANDFTGGHLGGGSSTSNLAGDMSEEVANFVGQYQTPDKGE